MAQDRLCFRPAQFDLMNLSFFRSATIITLLVLIVMLSGACGTADDAAMSRTPDSNSGQVVADPAIAATPTPEPTPVIPDLQAELTDGRFRQTASPLGSFDFLNFTYPLPRGWQNPDGSDITLTNGRLIPIPNTYADDTPDSEKAEAKAGRRIGMSHVVTKFFDATGDGQDEAIVILKIETAGHAIPQVIYIYEWKDEEPNLIWSFRTGDRSDGGIKDIRPENGQVSVELFGQDRFLLGEVETGKIYGDEEQICCPTHFTRTSYKWNGRHFLMQGKRLTFLVADPNAAPIENMIELHTDPKRNAKR